LLNYLSDKKLRFILSGVFCTITSFFYFPCFYYLTNEQFLVSYISGTFLSFLVSFLTQKYYVFKSTGKFIIEYIKYVFNAIVIIIISGFILKILIIYTDQPLISNIIVSCFNAIPSYFLHSYITFKNHDQKNI